MSQADTAHAWWSRLRHQGLLLSPVVMVERYPTAPPAARFPLLDKLRDEYTRFVSAIADLKDNENRDEATILKWADALLEKYVGYVQGQVAKQHDARVSLAVPVRIGTRTETIRPHRVVFSDGTGTTTAMLVMADTSPHVGRGRGRTKYAQFLELLRGTGHRLGLLTNGSQFRLIYAGIDFESWCEWESERWFDGGEGTEELNGLRQFLSPESLKPVKSGVSGLLDAVEESRKRQADLSSVLRENVRQAVELILEDVSTSHRTKPDLFAALVASGSERQLTDAEAHEALLQATVRIVMRMVVCLFAESRQLLPINDPIYAQAYGMRALYELLDEAARHEGGTHVLFNRQTAWPRFMALCRLVHSGSSHGAFPLRPYGGLLFRPGNPNSPDAVARALHILEYDVSVGDATIYYVLRKLLRGPLPVVKGHQKTFVEGPVDYTDLRTEFIGLIYEGLLDYRLKRTDEQTGPQVFLNLGREPVLPLSRLRDMLENDRKGLKDLLTTLKKEKVTASVASEEEESEEEDEEQGEAEEETTEEVVVEADAGVEAIQRPGDYLDAVEAAKAWAREAVVLAGLVGKQGKRETDSEYQKRIAAEADKLINRVVAPGEFYLVRAGNTRKGTGTFYTRPQLAVPTVHRTLEPLCFDKADDGTLTPKPPEHILGLKVCDPACGSASFPVAALHYLTEALYKSLCHHKKLDDPSQAKWITIPYGRRKNGSNGDELLPFPPDDPERGEMFPDRVKALLRRHVVERCIYGVDINPLAVELARVSLWVETLDPDLPFSFLDHKIKVGNSLVGCWLDRVEDYPLKAWEREGGDGKNGPRTQRIEEFLKGPKIGKTRSGDGRIKKEMRELLQAVADHRAGQPSLLAEMKLTIEAAITQARTEYESLHSLPIADPDERERFYREHVQASPALRRLKQAMDEWCAVWFWPADEESLSHVPTPLSFHKPSQQTAVIIERLAVGLNLFHWELEFPDVFTPQRSGFDAVLGNPPWETVQQESMEFFTEYDPIYRTYGKQAALRRQRELFVADPHIRDHWDDYCSGFAALAFWVKACGEPFDVFLARGREEKQLKSEWSQLRSCRVGFANTEHPFAFQGNGKTYSYKAFIEVGYHLLTNEGRIGFIVPSGLYTDAGTHRLRELFLHRATWEWLFGFINWDQIFNIYYRFKFALVIIERLPSQQDCSIHSCFGRYKLQDWEMAESVAFSLPIQSILEFSPKTLSVLEVTNQRDLGICRKIYAHSVRIGDNMPGYEISYAQEFNMTTDSKHFPPLEEWKGGGYKPDIFGRWIGPDGDVALPLYEGRMVGQFDFSQKGWVSGKGRTAVWREVPFDAKAIEPQFLLAESVYDDWPKAHRHSKIAFMDVASSTNARSFIGSFLRGFPTNHKTPTLTVSDGTLIPTIQALAILNSFVFDYVLRNRLGGLSLGWFILEECPLPRTVSEEFGERLIINSCRLNLLHRLFAPEWLRLRTTFSRISSQEWKRWWGVTEADRLRLRLENDAICSDLYGLEPEDFDWILRDDPKDPKGFLRVDKHLPFRERLTGLAALAFRALKDGKWSAESAPCLSNDEFFDILGIPELTNAAAAEAKGLSGPLILKRKGCHVWKPENFPPNDPRHGWTWDDCWQDAVALLGSKEAVEKYIVEKPEEKPETGEEGDGEEKFELEKDEPRARQRKMF